MGKHLLEELDGMLMTLGGEWGDAFEGIGDAELLVFVGAHGVIGEEFYALHIVVLGKVAGQSGEALVVVGVVGHEHVANPGGFVDVAEMVEEGLVVLAGVAGVGGMEGVVECLDVEKDKIGVLQCLAGFLVEDDAAGVEGGVEVGLFAEAEKVGEKVCLHEGFAARERDSAA